MSISDVVTVFNTAGLGVVAYLLLTRVEGRLMNIEQGNARTERAINRLVRVQAMELLNRPDVHPVVRREAQVLIEEMSDEATAKALAS